MLEWSLKCDVSDLEFTGAIRRNEDEMDARMLRSKEPPKLLTLVHGPDVEYEYDACVGGEAVQLDASLGIRHDDVLDVFLHRLLVAPVILAEGEVNLRCGCIRRERRKRASGLALKDKLQWEEIAVE